MKCFQCQTVLPDAARFCFNCGAQQEAIQEEAIPESGPIRWLEDLVPQLEGIFSTVFDQRLSIIGDEKKKTDYRERLYRSGFRDTVHHRLQQLADELDRQHKSLNFNETSAIWRIDRVVRDLSDFFLIRNTNDLHPFALPESILKYQDANWATVDIRQMILDYLDFTQEKLRVYTDLLTMPIEKLRRAGRSWFTPARDEQILLLCDLSVLGSLREGFGITEEAIYWKAQLQEPQAIAFPKLYSIKREADWLLINDQFFNAGPSLNTKMFLLLEKLADLNT